MEVKEEEEAENEVNELNTQSVAKHHFDEVETTDRKHIPSALHCTVSCRDQMKHTAETTTEQLHWPLDRRT